MKKRFFLPGVAILLLLVSSCEKENSDSLNPSQFHSAGALLSSPIFNVTFGDSMGTYGASATKSNDGGYIIAGVIRNVVDVSKNPPDGWLVKIDRYGNKLWQKAYGGSELDAFHSIASTTDGGYIIAGETWSNDGDISGFHGRGGLPDFWVVKTDASGNIAWSKAFGSGSSEIAYSVIESSDGNYVVVGTSNVSRGYAIKLDKSGNILWEKIKFDIEWPEEFKAVMEDPDGNYILSGFGNNRTNNMDIMLVKLNKNGEVLFSRPYGGLALEYAFSATLSQDGAYILAGQRRNIDEINSDIIVIKVNKEGICLWERVFKTPEVESEPKIITLDNGGFLIVKNTNLDIFTLFGSWIKLDKEGNKLEAQKVADQTKLTFLIKGVDNNFLTGGRQDNFDRLPNMSVIGFQIP